MDRTIKFAVSSVVVALIVLALKFLAYQLTSSVALYSDALESIINVAAAIAVLIALSIASKPADKNHPYGHSKAEYFSAVAEGVLIVLAAISIGREAILALQSKQVIHSMSSGLFISIFATLINTAWAAVLIRVGKTARSPALLADGRHILSDVVTSIGVLIGVALANLTGLQWIDPAVAILVALNILWSGWRLTRESVSGLMDAGIDTVSEARIRQAMSQHAEGALEMHDLRTRHAGRITFIEFHLVVPGDMTVTEAHSICDRLEEVIKTELPGSHVTIHVEPQDKAKHHGVLII